MIIIFVSNAFSISLSTITPAWVSSSTLLSSAPSWSSFLSTMPSPYHCQQWLQLECHQVTPSSQAKVTLEYNYRHKRMSGKKFFHHSHHIRLRVKESKPTRFLKKWLQMSKMTVCASSSQARVTLEYNYRHERMSGNSSTTPAIK